MSREIDVLRRPFRATGAELEFYASVAKRWRTLSGDAVLTEAARLFHFAVAIAGSGPDADCAVDPVDGIGQEGLRATETLNSASLVIEQEETKK